MKCKFEHDGTCCNSGTFQFKDTCDPKNCNYRAPMSRGDVFRTSSDEELAEFLSVVMGIMDCPRRVWDLNEGGLSYQDAWLKWLQESCE